MKNWVVNNFWIKIISLILAIITWFYVNGELDKEKRISNKLYQSYLSERPRKQPTTKQKQMNRGYIMEKK